VRLRRLDPATVDHIVGADPNGLDAVQRRMQLGYQRHLTATDGRTPLRGEELINRLRQLREEGRGWVTSGRGPQNSKFAGQRVFFRDGGSPASTRTVSITTCTGTRTSRHTPGTRSTATTGDRDLDIRLANRLFQRRGDPLWQGVAPGDTPEGWTWHHVQGGRKMQLVPTAVHAAARHTGGIGTSPSASGG
jgi:hypothetical protein